MKRLLRRDGNLYIHLDWHAVHYVKAEADKIFGVQNLRNEIIWYYANKLPTGGSLFDRHHDVILWYSKTAKWTFNEIRVDAEYRGTQLQTRKVGGKRVPIVDPETGKQVRKASTDKPCGDVWRINMIHPQSPERIGYPTQKPEELMERIVMAGSKAGATVADFFVGGGTTPAVAQHLGRRWIACDQSRVAVAITADRLARSEEQRSLNEATIPVPDFTVEHWGIYEAKRLADTPPDQFKEFVIRAFGAVPDGSQPGIHGHKGAVPVWVGEPSQKSQVTAQDVQDFANAVRKTTRYQQDNLRDGSMLAWAFRPDAVETAQKLRNLEATELNFVRLDLIRIDSPQFREHVAALSTDRADYTTFLTFVQPPRVEVGWRKVSGRQYKFDVSETAVLNAGAKIINVQWDFDYADPFSSTQGYSFIRTAKKEPALQVDYTFPKSGTRRIACKVQDDAGGEGIWVGEVSVS